MHARLGLVLAFGSLLVACGDSSAAGVEVEAGGVAGAAGAAGSVGFQGGAGLGGSGGSGVPPGSYEFTCTAPGIQTPLPFQIIIETADFDGSLEVGKPSELRTQLGYVIVSNNLVVGLDLPGLIADVRATVGVEGAAPSEIAHTAEGLPLDSQIYRFDSNVVVTDPLMPPPGSTAVQLSVSAFSIRVTELPTAFFAQGELELVAGQGNCGAIVPSEGSGSLVFPVDSATAE